MQPSKMPKKSIDDQQLPTISLITPSFNQGKFIKKTIDSVLQQAYPNLEYWVIDGGSSDDTLSILKQYQQQHAQVFHFISEKDHGQAHALNKGMARLTGEVVGYLNADDCLLPGSLHQVGQYFADHPNTLWLTGDCEIIDETGKSIQSSVALYKKFWRLINSMTVLSILNPIAQPATFWRREAQEVAGKFDESLNYCMDYDLWFRLFEQAKPVVIDQILAQFRIHASSKGGSAFELQFQEEIEVAKRYQTFLFIQALHQLHAWATVQIYKLIKPVKI